LNGISKRITREDDYGEKRISRGKELGEDAGLPDRTGRDPHKPGQSPALHEREAPPFGMQKAHFAERGRSARIRSLVFQHDWAENPG
jgi:hypothetical protein